MNVLYPYICLWKVNAWLTGVGHESCSFSVFVSRRFLEAARKVEYDAEMMQEQARCLARGAGLRISTGQKLLHLGKYGLEQIDWPAGDGCWLHLEQTSIRPEGAAYSTHNSDNPLQQSFLMSVWLWWTQIVEMHVQM